LPPPDELRLRAYGFIGAALQIGIAWLDGQLPLTMDEVIDQLVDVFYRISGIAPPTPPDIASDPRSPAGSSRVCPPAGGRSTCL
jgi:hypothetical protein